jgi:CHAT domain-containing protein
VARALERLARATEIEETYLVRILTGGSESERQRAADTAVRDAHDTGVLTALEVSRLDLWGTRLVVLSACETGLGEVRDGEGVYGLRRALVLAGAESQVISLWRVPSVPTRALMRASYDRLHAGLGRSEALHAAQRQMLGGAHGHPYAWAAFIPSGAWEPMPSGD